MSMDVPFRDARHMTTATSPTAGRRHRPRHGRYFGSYPAISRDWRRLIASMTASSAPVSVPVAWLAHLTTLLPPCLTGHHPRARRPVPTREKNRQAQPSRHSNCTQPNPIFERDMLWFSPPDGDDRHRRALSRERVVAEAFTIIGADGVDALSMRVLAARLGVVPGALYRHVRSKGQLCDLVVDGVLAEVDCQIDRSLVWAEQVKVLARRLRTVLENHPGIAGLLKTRDPLGRTPSPWPRRSSHRCKKPACPSGRPPWLSASFTTTPWVSRSATAPPSTSSASRTPRPGASCTHS